MSKWWWVESGGSWGKSLTQGKVLLGGDCGVGGHYVLFKMFVSPLLFFIPPHLQHIILSPLLLNPSKSHLHLMRVIARTHASTLATNLARVENIMRHFCLWLIVWDIGMEKMEKKKKIRNIKLNTWSLISPSLAWMLSFHVWLQNKWKILSLE